MVRAHTCTVTLPDQSTCQVHYTRYNARSHKFDFGSPIHQRLWIDPFMDGTARAVEEKAQEIAAEAFRMAQAAEVKEMQRKTLPAGAQKPDRKDPQTLSCKAADECAGKYAVCLRLLSGTLMRLGDLHELPEQAVEEIASDRHDPRTMMQGQAMVIGICNRAHRRWQEPRFLIDRPCLLPDPISG
jgi:hypothetical protein